MKPAMEVNMNKNPNPAPEPSPEADAFVKAFVDKGGKK